MTYLKYWSQIVIGAPNDNFNLTWTGGGGGGPTAVTLTAGSYYFDSTTAAESLVTQIKTQLETVDSSADTYTVEIDTAGTGLIRIKNQQSHNFTIAWTDAPLRDLLGFTGTLSGAADYIGTNKVQYAWYPDTQGRENYTDRILEKTRLVGRSLDGQVYALGDTNKRESRKWEHHFLSKTVAYSPASPDESWGWEDFWDYHARTGLAFRVWADRTLANNAYEATYMLGEKMDDSTIERQFANLESYWTVKPNLYRHVNTSGVAD